jgi:hypothetical protein
MEQGKPEVTVQKPVLLPNCPPQIPKGLAKYRSRASAVTEMLLIFWQNMSQ